VERSWDDWCGDVVGSAAMREASSSLKSMLVPGLSCWVGNLRKASGRKLWDMKMLFGSKFEFVGVAVLVGGAGGGVVVEGAGEGR
jgi:hypothetical protein